MTKLSVIAAASALVLASSAAFAAQAPAGFENAGNPAAPAGLALHLLQPTPSLS